MKNTSHAPANNAGCAPSMPSDQELRGMLLDAIQAPSGDNVQPWRFHRTSEALEVLNDPTADTSLYNAGQSASLISIGALLYNLELSAPSFGYEASVVLFPDSAQPDLVARVRFERGAIRTAGLYPAIKERCTNRSPYEDKAITNDDRAIFAYISDPVEVVMVEGEAKDAVASAAAMNEKIVLENKAMHDFLFSHVTWSEAQDASHPGFFVDTLGLNAIQRTVFGMYRNWNAANVLNWFGFANLVVRDNAAMYKRSSAAVALIASTTDAKTFVHAGRVLQEIWLKTTAVKLSLQPLAGIPLLSLSVRAGEAKGLSDEHRRIANEAYMNMERAFSSQGKHILFAARIGYAQPPSARTRRRELTIE